MAKQKEKLVSSNVEITELEKQIEALEEQIRHAEQHEQYDTAHHEMLRRLKAQPKKEEKERINA